MENPLSQGYKDEIVAAYTAAGFTLIPCGNKNRAKAPRFDNWRDTPYNPHLNAKELPHIFGVLLQADDVVIDYDPRRDKRDNQLQEFFTLLGIPEANTFIVKTGALDPGYHLYFKKPEHVKLRHTHPQFPALEFFTKGSIVIGAASIHPDTHEPYTVRRGTPDAIVQAPDQLLQFLQVDPNLTAASLVTDDTATRSQFIDLLLATPPAIEGEGGDFHTYQLALQGHDYGLPEATTAYLMLEYFNPKCLPVWKEKDMRGKVASAYNSATLPIGNSNPEAVFKDIDIAELTGVSPYTEPRRSYEDPIWYDPRKWVKDGRKQIKPVLINGINYFLMPKIIDTEWNPLLGLLKYNLFTHKIEFTRPAPWGNQTANWTDDDTIGLSEHLSRKSHFIAPPLLFNDVALAVARRYSYHPIKDYLQALNWDGQPRIDTLLIDHAGAACTPYVKEVTKNTLIAAVARIMTPGCQHDSMLILEGEQGIGKTSLVRILGGQWYGDVAIDPGNKDTIAAMLDFWIIEQSELAGLKRADVNKLKRFLTTTKDDVRLAYRRNTETYPRHNIFIGTINIDSCGYLQDETGNRRFWPVTIRQVDLQAIARERDQIWAEAYARWEQGDVYHIISPILNRIAVKEQSNRMVVDPWNEFIVNYLERVDYPDAVTNEDIINFALGISYSTIGHLHIKRIGRIMRQAGYSYTQIRHDQTRIRVWAKIDSQLEGL